VYSPQDSVSRGEVDIDLLTPAWAASHLNAGDPVPVLAGVHSGSLEPFAREPIRTISDLKSKKIAVEYIGSSSHMLLPPIANHIGLDSQQDTRGLPSNCNGRPV
jgi:NitT/TauT family transport system substrate-binding protein